MATAYEKARKIVEKWWRMGEEIRDAADAIAKNIVIDKAPPGEGMLRRSLELARKIKEVAEKIARSMFTTAR